MNEIIENKSNDVAEVKTTVEVSEGFIKFVNRHRKDLIEKYRSALYKCYSNAKYKAAYQDLIEDKIQQLKKEDYYPTEDDSKWVEEFVWAVSKGVDF